MIRVSDGILIAAVLAGAVWTYQIKHEADVSAKKLASLKSQIAAQNRKIALLEADWAIETGPARLAAIAKRFEKQLQLRPMESTQIIDVSELPGFKVDRDPVDEETWVKKDGETITGGIGVLLSKEKKQ